MEKDDVDAPEGNANLGAAVSANPLSFAPMFGRSFGNGVQYCGTKSAAGSNSLHGNHRSENIFRDHTGISGPGTLTSENASLNL